MPKIKLLEETADKAWEALIEIGAVHRVSKEEIYLVSTKQIEHLEKLGIPFERLDDASTRPKV